MSEVTVSHENPKPLSLIGTTLASIQSRDVEGLLGNLQQLNQKLTGGMTGAHFKDDDTLRTEIRRLFGDLERSEEGDADVIVYLGDDGYSRLDIGIDYDRNPFVSLTNNSTPEVKERWKAIEEEHQRSLLERPQE